MKFREATEHAASCPLNAARYALMRDAGSVKRAAGSVFCLMSANGQ
jgi:hypothetical protein